jgi:FkbM family methyltransferase
MDFASIGSPKDWSRSRLAELAKTELRNALHRRNLDLVRDPASSVLIRALRWLDIDTVIDVGANVGQYGSGIRASGYTGRIISCEPLPDAFAQLERRAASDARWTPVHTAVGSEIGSVRINVSANSYSSSILPVTDAHLSAAPASRVTSTVVAPSTRVADLVRRHSIDPSRTLLKVDTQGYEGPVLEGAGGLLPDFAMVQLELSMLALYDGQLLFQQVVDRLRELGFTLFSLDPGFADPVSGRMLQCDGLFVPEARLAAL